MIKEVVYYCEEGLITIRAGEVSLNGMMAKTAEYVVCRCFTVGLQYELLRLFRNHCVCVVSGVVCVVCGVWCMVCGVVCVRLVLCVCVNVPHFKTFR